MRAIVFVAVLALASYASGANIVNSRRAQNALTETAGGPPGSGFQPAKPTDCRSPCPALNTLANHGVLPRTGKGLNYDMLKTALIDVLGLSTAFGTIFAHAATKKFADPATGQFDLCVLLTNLHEKVPASGASGIEHSASVSREDRPDFDHKFDPSERSPSLGQIQILLDSSSDGKVVSVSDFVKARTNLWNKTFARRPNAKTDALHTQEAIIADVEGCLLLGALSGNSNNGKFQISKDYARSILLNEQFPPLWQKSTRALGIPELIGCLVEQKVAWAANEFNALTAISKNWFAMLF